MMRTLLLTMLLAGCAVRAELRPAAGEARVVLFEGATLRGAGDAEVELPPRMPARVVAVNGPECKVTTHDRGATLEGVVSCDRLGLVVKRPSALHIAPGGPVRLTLNGGVLVAPRERRGDWVRVRGDALGTFEGWMSFAQLGAASEQEWLAPGLPRYPWVCEDGSWLYDRPGGTFLLWLPGPWCRVHLLGERGGWRKIEYLDQRIRVVGWVEGSTLRPDREPRFHPGARLTEVRRRTPIFAQAMGTAPFAHLEPGVRIWASLTFRGRTLVQTHAAPIELVGWVDTHTLAK